MAEQERILINTGEKALEFIDSIVSRTIEKYTKCFPSYAVLKKRFDRYMWLPFFGGIKNTIAGALLPEYMEKLFFYRLQQETKSDFGFCMHYNPCYSELIKSAFNDETEDLFDRCAKPGGQEIVDCNNIEERCCNKEKGYKVGRSNGSVPPTLMPRAGIVKRRLPNLPNP